MKTAYLLVPVLCATPFLDSCTTVATSLAGYGIQSMLEVRHASESPEAYYQLGRYYQAQNRFEEAAKAYERALALRSDYVEAANALATSYAMQGQYELAIAKLEVAVERSPKAAFLHNNLGYIYCLQGRYPAAIASLEAATRLEPENRRAWRNLALAYGKSGAADKSREAYARASRVTPGVAQSGWASTPLSNAQQGDRINEQTGPAQTSAVLSAARSAAQTAPLAILTDTAGSVDIVPAGPNIYELRPLNRVSDIPVQEAATAHTAISVTGPALPAEAKSPVRAFRLEVSNGNGKNGMAHRVALKLKRVGMNPVRLTNQRPWQPVSEIQYTEEYASEAAQLAEVFGQEPLMIRNDKLRRDINVRLVLGKDIRNETALFEPRDPGAARIASAN